MAPNLKVALVAGQSPRVAFWRHPLLLFFFFFFALPWFLFLPLPLGESVGTWT